VLAAGGSGSAGLGVVAGAASCEYFKIGYDADGDGILDQVIYDDPFDSAQVSLAYDAAGNLTDDGIYTYKYDAWNRLVEVRRSGGSQNLIAACTYDGLGRRIKKVVSNSGDRDGTQWFYYDRRWRVLEVRDEADRPDRQFVWGATYIDEAIAMDVDTDNDDDCLDFDDTGSNPDGGAGHHQVQYKTRQ